MDAPLTGQCVVRFGRVARALEAGAHVVQLVRIEAERRMRLARRSEGFLDADVERLAAIETEPHASAASQGSRLRDLGEAEEIAEVAACVGFAARRGGDLHVVEARHAGSVASGSVPEPYVHRLRVRYGECDPQGIVFNAHYLAFFDIALTELWRDALPGGYPSMIERGFDMVVAEATCRYVASAGFDDLLDIAVRVAHLGTTSLGTAIQITRAGEPVVEGEMRHVFVDLATRAKAPIPEWVRAALAPWVAAAA